MDASWLPVTGSVGWWALIATAGALVTKIGPWYRGLVKPWWKPPDWVFGPMWTTVFLTTGYGCVLAWRGGGTEAERQLFLVACVVNGLSNVMWSVLFFRLQRPDWAMVQVVPFWGTIFWMYWCSRPLAYEAGIWFAPYLGWVVIATYLNWMIVRLNGPFRGR